LPRRRFDFSREVAENLLGLIGFGVLNKETSMKLRASLAFSTLFGLVAAGTLPAQIDDATK